MYVHVCMHVKYIITLELINTLEKVREQGKDRELVQLTKGAHYAYLYLSRQPTRTQTHTQTQD